MLYVQMSQVAYNTTFPFLSGCRKRQRNLSFASRCSNEHQMLHPKAFTLKLISEMKRGQPTNYGGKK